ncbi:MAG: hypothetical protein A2293_07990 [Elusimicrobia bacterium RIFOXYB2_FULL_49_7]|nr:MAG: hypothetical protein A2293_07990 [Elusimicrobia bacterium RIFOXYB2_FULL_49_7]
MADMKPLSLKDFAIMLGISKVTAWRWLRTQGVPRPRKIGKKFFLDRDEVMEWWEQKGRIGKKTYQPEVSL